MGSNKYAEELRKEKNSIASSNPFAKSSPKKIIDYNNPRSVPFVNTKENNGNYFTLILNSDFEDIEMEIRGLRYYKEIQNNKEVIITRRIAGHYLSESGSEDLLLELKAHLSPDIKLGVMSRDEFLQQQEIIRKWLVSYVSNNLYKLGMDTEEKQRKSPTLLVMMLARIRSVYSRSIAGMENKASHGDIKITGDLDMEKENRFRMEDIKN